MMVWSCAATSEMANWQSGNRRLGTAARSKARGLRLRDPGACRLDKVEDRPERLTTRNPKKILGGGRGIMATNQDPEESGCPSAGPSPKSSATALRAADVSWESGFHGPKLWGDFKAIARDVAGGGTQGHGVQARRQRAFQMTADAAGCDEVNSSGISCPPSTTSSPWPKSGPCGDHSRKPCPLKFHLARMPWAPTCPVPQRKRASLVSRQPPRPLPAPETSILREPRFGGLIAVAAHLEFRDTENVPVSATSSRRPLPPGISPDQRSLSPTRMPTRRSDRVTSKVTSPLGTAKFPTASCCATPTRSTAGPTSQTP